MLFGQIDTAELSNTAVDGYVTASTWLGDNIATIGRVILIFFVAWVVVHVGVALISGVLKRTIRSDMYPTKTDRDKRLKTLEGISGAAIRFIVWIIAGFMILDSLGVNTAPILASAGIIGVALGFGTQSLVKDFISGLFIIVENQYRVGDYIEVQNVSGTVESITMRTTILRDIDGSVHCVPNGSIVVSTNRTMGAGHTVLDITVSTDADLRVLESTINEVGQDMAKDPKLGKMITEPPRFIRISEFNDKGVIVKVSSTTASGKQLEIKSAFLARLRAALEEKNISIISAIASKTKK